MSGLIKYKIVQGDKKFYLLKFENNCTQQVQRLPSSILEIENNYGNIVLKIGNITYLLIHIGESIYELIELEHNLFPITIDGKTLFYGFIGWMCGGPVGCIVGVCFGSVL